MLSNIEIVSFDAEAANCYGRIRAELVSKGTPIGPLDTMIAAHAQSLGCTIVTNNVREFKRVKDLKIENWTKT
jgi:tRNA(fMet)-specific endonuclease VapC